MVKLLEGVKIVSLGQAVAAPYASSRLADLGADVVKIERPGGDFARRYDDLAKGESATFAWLNRGVASLELDLTVGSGRGQFDKLLRVADVFIHNLSPEAETKLDLGAEAISKINARIIHCAVSGYSGDTPYAEKKAYDLLIQAETGLASVTGIDSRPARVGVSVVDLATGQAVMSAVLAALFDRARTGKGRALKVAMFDVMADWMSMPLMAYLATGSLPRKDGFEHPSIAPYGLFVDACGGSHVVAIQNEDEWQRFAVHVLGDKKLAVSPEFSSNVLRVKNRKVLREKIQASFATRSTEELEMSLESHGVASARLRDVGDLAVHPALRLQDVKANDSLVTMPASPFQIDQCRRTGERAPALNDFWQREGAFQEEVFNG